MIALMKIEAKRMSRDKTTIIMSIGLPIFFYLIFSSLIQVPKAYEQTFYTEYLMSMTAFSLCSFALFTFPFDIIQDKKNGWRMRLAHVDLSATEIYAVKMVKMISMYIVAVTSVFLVGKIAKGVNLTLNQWLVSGGVLILGGILFLGIGVTLSLFKHEKTASVCANIMYLGMASVGGLWIPTSEFPEWLQPFSKTMPTYQFRELAVGYINKGVIPIKAVVILAAYSFGFIIFAAIINKKQKIDIRS
ncbi:ABC transporter permease [Vagococcus sp.]|uniref:ABC transporter permease n=1 Tax=Vagococcus sp. TaxID=1933889 RepID=UPI002FC90E41